MRYSPFFLTALKLKKSLNEVRTMAKDHPLLGKLATSKIRDKIRTYFKDDADMDADSPKLPEEEESAEQKLKRFGVPTIHGKFIHTYTVTPQNPFLLNAARAQNGISCRFQVTIQSAFPKFVLNIPNYITKFGILRENLQRQICILVN